MMKKSLIVIPNNNKYKFAAKGFAEAFKDFDFFVFEKKSADLNIDEINTLTPDIIMIFWEQKGEHLEQFFNSCSLNSVFIHLSEYIDNIPKQYRSLKNHYIFAADAENQKELLLPAVSAADYKTNKEEFSSFKYNITFAGNPASDIREKTLSALIRTFGIINIFSRSYDFYKSAEEIRLKKLLNEDYTALYIKSYRGFVNNQSGLADIYSSSAVNLDMPAAGEKAINYRLLEITASSGFVIARCNDFISNTYDIGRELDVYYNIEDLIDKISFYLKHPRTAAVIAENGRKKTVKKFTYYDELEKMLELIYGKNFNSR